jgi:glycosyltransferase involved in cell wall biosynthesis
MPRVSIVITCYNLGAYLGEAVASAHAQTYPDCEIIVADDGSQDPSTINILDGMAGRDIRILRLPHAGLPAARNHGIAAASGEFICCLDADDRYHPAFVHRCLEAFSEAPDIGIASTWLETFGESTVLWKPAPASAVALAANNCIHVASMFRRKAWEQTGGYSNEMSEGYEDWDFWLSIVLAGWRCVVVPETLFFYRRRQGSMIAGSHAHGPELYRRIIERHKSLYREKCVEILVEKQKQVSEFQALVASQDQLVRQQSTILRDTESQLREEMFRNSRNSYIIRNLAERYGIAPDELRLLGVKSDIRLRLEELGQRVSKKPLPIAIFGSGSRGRLVFSCLNHELFHLEGWYDNNPSAHGTDLGGVTVQHPIFRPGITVLIASIESAVIRRQLEELGYAPDSIVEV